MLSGIQDENVHSIVWYNKKVNISKKQIHNKKTLLHFEGSDYITKVWVNGQFVGENVGAYARFSFDIENYMVEGENDITVKVEDSLSKFQPRGKQAIDESEYIKRFEELTNAIKNIPNISGYCYTQLTDVQQEINGILNENRKTKFNKEIMKKIKDLNNKGE